MNFIAASFNTVSDSGALDAVSSNTGEYSLKGIPFKILSAATIIILILMFKKILALFQSKPPLESFDQTLTREQLIHYSRILLVDDEDPLLIIELKSEGFSVDHDREGQDLRV